MVVCRCMQYTISKMEELLPSNKSLIMQSVKQSCAYELLQIFCKCSTSVGTRTPMHDSSQTHNSLAHALTCSTLPCGLGRAAGCLLGGPRTLQQGRDIWQRTLAAQSHLPTQGRGGCRVDGHHDIASGLLPPYHGETQG